MERVQASRCAVGLCVGIEYKLQTERMIRRSYPPNIGVHHYGLQTYVEDHSLKGSSWIGSIYTIGKSRMYTLIIELHRSM